MSYLDYDSRMVAALEAATGQSVAGAGPFADYDSRVVGASAVPVSVGSTTAETALATIALPAGAMGPNGILRISISLVNNNDADDKITRVRLGGIAGTSFYTVTNTTAITVRVIVLIQNRGAENSQFGGIHPATTTVGTTGTVDTSAAVDIVISGQKEVAGDTLTLESYMVELLAG
jgi:hypothetical protein